MAEQIGAHSERTMQTILDGIRGVLPVLVQAIFENRMAAEQGSVKLAFPGLWVTAEVGEWQEEEGNLLSFKSPIMGDFVTVGRKQSYAVCVKTCHLNEIRQKQQVALPSWSWGPCKGGLEGFLQTTATQKVRRPPVEDSP